MDLSPCPNCGGTYFATDSRIATKTTHIVCCGCQTEGPRGIDAHQAEGLWNDWAESQAEQLDPIGQIIHY